MMSQKTKSKAKGKPYRLADWVPTWCLLPDSLEAIERGRLAQRSLFVEPEAPDDTRAGRLARLTGCTAKAKR